MDSGHHLELPGTKKAPRALVFATAAASPCSALRTRPSPSNFKNVLKSGGSGIVAIEDLSGDLDGFEAFVRRLITPVALFVFELLVEGDDGEGAAVDFEGIFFHRRAAFCGRGCLHR